MVPWKNTGDAGMLKLLDETFALRNIQIDGR